MPPAAILFDLDDTILTSGDPRDLWRSCIAAHRHRFDGVDAEALHAEILQVAALFWSDAERHRRGRLRIKQARRGIVATAAENLGYDDSAAAVALADAYHERRETDVVPFAGALETLQLLQERGIPMALVTN
ncbi:MAG: HAD family hydrolase, partial [Myxococcales bacterium]|nr:HAD family hydrolase [Myxococcales bacterium]